MRIEIPNESELFILKFAFRELFHTFGWMTVVKNADWDTADDIKKTFGAADLLGNGSNRVIFNIAGNNNRVLCKYHFGYKQVHLFICWIGTHAEYDKLCDKNEQYTVSIY